MSARLAASAAPGASPARKRHAPPAPPRRRRKPDPSLTVVKAPPRLMRVVGPMALASVFAVLLLMAMFHALIVQGQRELDRVTNEIETAQAVGDKLQLELAEKEAPERIVAAARAFGMVDAPEVVYLSPEDNTSDLLVDDGPPGDSQPGDSQQ